MKAALMTLFACWWGHALLATDYYSQGSGDPAVLSHWNTTPSGSGLTPSGFSIPGDRFIIQQGHTLVTTSEWTFGTPSSILQLHPGAILRADHAIFFTGTLLLDSNATYIHNNTAVVTGIPGASIFGAATLFNPHSNFIIQRWSSKNTALPASIDWGNLVIDLKADISADVSPWRWNATDGSVIQISGNLDIRATYVTIPCDIWMTPSGIQRVNILGNLCLSGFKTRLNIKKDAIDPVTGYTTVQVSGNIMLMDWAQLDLGSPTTYSEPFGNYELRFKGNFTSKGSSLILNSSGWNSCLTANGNSLQSFDCLWWFGGNLKIDKGSTLELARPLTLSGDDKFLAVLGTFRQNNQKLFVAGKIECAGGRIYASGVTQIGLRCTACTGDGVYNYPQEGWCGVSGNRGEILFENAVIELDNSYGDNYFEAGRSAFYSPGSIVMINSRASSIYTDAPFSHFVLSADGLLSLDGSSTLLGEGATYQANGGTLRIGSPSGISKAGDVINGNIITGAGKDYDHSGINNYEYVSSIPQRTGDGLPDVIAGTFTVDNSAGLGTNGLTLSKPVSLQSALELKEGKLSTSDTALLTMKQHAFYTIGVPGQSFVNGPLKKVGSATFTFPIGKGNNYAPLTLSGPGHDSDSYIAEYFMANPVTTYGNSFAPPVQDISHAEWWTVNRVSGISSKTVTLEATAYTNATQLDDLRVLGWNGLNWYNAGNTATSGISVGPVTSGPVSTFLANATPTPFTFGYTTNGPVVLPLKFVSVSATRLANDAGRLNWLLSAAAPAGTQFQVEQAGPSLAFSKAGTVMADGLHSSFQWQDVITPGTNYFRIKMTEPGGAVSFSKTVQLVNDRQGVRIVSVDRVNDQSISVRLVSSSASLLTLVVTDMSGKVLSRQSFATQTGTQQLQLHIPACPRGIYHVYGYGAEGRTNVARFLQ